MKARIGVSMNYHLSEEGMERAYLDEPYFAFVEEFGAIPIPICPTDNIVQLDALLGPLDGVVFTGGLDLDSALWDEDLHKATELVHARRQRFDLMLYDQVQKQKLPILAMCLGMQMINVAHGGSLHQHLPDLDFDYEIEVDHGGDDGMTEHKVNVDLNSRLFEILRHEKFNVNSGHHQGINRLGDGLVPCATAEDGIVEAFERPDYPFFLAVQWHPERDLANPVNTGVMEHFLKASKETATLRV
jgi:putative glutamine amidotransferase